MFATLRARKERSIHKIRWPQHPFFVRYHKRARCDFVNGRETRSCFYMCYVKRGEYRFLLCSQSLAQLAALHLNTRDSWKGSRIHNIKQHDFRLLLRVERKTKNSRPHCVVTNKTFNQSMFCGSQFFQTRVFFFQIFVTIFFSRHVAAQSKLM